MCHTVAWQTNKNHRYNQQNKKALNLSSRVSGHRGERQWIWLWYSRVTILFSVLSMPEDDITLQLFYNFQHLCIILKIFAIFTFCQYWLACWTASNFLCFLFSFFLHSTAAMDGLCMPDSANTILFNPYKTSDFWGSVPMHREVKCLA